MPISAAVHEALSAAAGSTQLDMQVPTNRQLVQSLVSWLLVTLSKINLPRAQAVYLFELADKDADGNLTRAEMTEFAQVTPILWESGLYVEQPHAALIGSRPLCATHYSSPAPMASSELLPGIVIVHRLPDPCSGGAANRRCLFRHGRVVGGVESSRVSWHSLPA